MILRHPSPAEAAAAQEAASEARTPSREAFRIYADEPLPPDKADTDDGADTP